MEPAPMDKWFVLTNGIVTGPFLKSQIEERIGDLGHAVIWGRGLNEWVPSEKWMRAIQDIQNNQASATSARNDRAWKIRAGGQALKPMTYAQMIDFLKTKTNLDEIQIWTDGYNEWKDVYQIHKVMDELGVSRRTHPRVPIMGSLLCEGTTGQFTARVLSISEGGLGITEAPSIKIGEKFKTFLKSPNLFAPINATVEVVYVGADGYAGLKFLGIQAEAQSAVIEYVKKFSEVKKQDEP